MLVWLFLALVIQNEIRLPSPIDVFKRMILLLQSKRFMAAVLATLSRSLSGLLVAFIMAVVIGIMAGLNQPVEEMFQPFYLVMKSIPNISYILIALIWVGREASVQLIGFMILFPMFYANVTKGIHAIDKDLQDVIALYPEKKATMIFKVYLPLISSYLIAALSNGLGLTFKVGIMAEIIGSLSVGIGREFQVCWLNVDMTGIFAWTLWVIILLAFIEYIIKVLEKQIKKLESISM